MKIDEFVMYPTQLVHVETTKIIAEKVESEVQKEFDISVDAEGEILDDITGKSIITIIIKNESYSLEIETVGIFKFDTEIDDKSSAEKFLETQAIRILWSYVREDIYTITSKMLSKPIMIPTIDVMKTLAKAK